MLRRVAMLVAAGLVTPWAAAARDLPLPVAELASSPFVAAPRAGSGPGSATAPSALLAWIDPTGVASGTEAIVRSEVARLLRGMGVTTSWRRAEPHELARPGELRVIFLDRTAERQHGTTVLGATPARFAGEPFVWVHVPSVRAAAGIAGPGRGLPLDIHSARQLGVAMSRVIAHEVVHAVAPSLPHGRGLMSARLDRATLTAASIKVDPEVALAVRSGLLGQSPDARPADEILAAESTRKETYR